MRSILTNKKILVTGGTGSIGEALVKRALKDNAKLIKIFSNDENGQYELEKELEANKKLQFLIGDVRDEDAVSNAVRDIDIIFHAAALKHVDRCELNPFETINVNILGTKNVINFAKREKVKKVIFISTDKAVNPVSVMGSTKLLAEKMISAESLNHNSSTIFTSVRFGNVLNTRGSILPFITKQISKGGPVTLTDERMLRFFMTKDDAVNLILEATKHTKGGEVFVGKMHLIKLKELFECMIEIISPKKSQNSKKIKTKIIGMRKGEKLIEELLTKFEMEHIIEKKKFFIIPSTHTFKKSNKMKSIQKKSFDKLAPLSKDEIKSILIKEKII